MKSEAAKKQNRKIGYLFTIVINAVLIYVFNNLLNWGVPFLTDDFTRVLWAFDISFGVTIFLNFTYLIHDGIRYRHLGQMVMAVIAIFVLWLLLIIFPFTFAGEPWAFWVKLACILGMAGSAIGFIVELVKLIMGKE